jgi:hypothetical protein
MTDRFRECAGRGVGPVWGRRSFGRGEQQLTLTRGLPGPTIGNGGLTSTPPMAGAPSTLSNR